MFEGKNVTVVVPSYNEEKQIKGVITTIPGFVDGVIVVDDCSTDKTPDVVREIIDSGRDGPQIALIRQEQNKGQGAAVARGIKEALSKETDIVCVMDGDGQMDPDELHLLVGPIAQNQTDYAKGNRLFHRDAWNDIPRYRYLGNAFLSMLTKIASGYWHVADSQSAYIAASAQAFEMIDLDALYPRFGYPNDLLVRMNVSGMRVADVSVRPVYNVGERSKMRLWKVIPTMMWLILRRFCWRMREKYIIRDFHPLVFFYLIGGLLGLMGLGLFVRMLWYWGSSGRIPPINTMVWVFCMISSLQFLLFAMWFDMEMNRHLTVDITPSRTSKRSKTQAPSRKDE